MLLIRLSQFEVFAGLPRQQFERDMAGYLQRYFPFEAGRAALDEWVSSGLDKASSYGFASRYEYSLVLALVAMLGVGFDEDPQLPWAAELLAAPGARTTDRIDGLYARALAFLGAAAGPKCGWLVRAKLRLLRQDMTVFDQAVHRRALAARLCERLQQLYPQKAAAVGERALGLVARQAIDITGAQGARATAPAFIHAVHMFYLGSAFDTDPCYPWTRLALPGALGGSVEARYERMHKLSLDYLEHSFRFGG